MNPKILDQKTGSSKNKVKRRSHQLVWTRMVKIRQAQIPVGSIQGGLPLPRVNTNPDDDDDDGDDNDDTG